MKAHRLPFLVALLLLLAGLLSPLHAAAPHPLRVLFLGHASEQHDSGKYLPILMQRLGREAIYFDYFTQPDCLNPDTLSRYDAVMLYADHKAIAPEQFAALSQFVENGHGLVAVHSASACFTNKPKFAALVGGRLKEAQAGVFKATILAKDHPVMTGVNEFSTWDETFVHDQINEAGRTVLAERVEGERHEPWTWVRTQGKGRVFYTASGHDERTWKNADFQILLRNAILWAVGDQVKAEWEKFLAGREPEKREPNANVANYERRPEPVTFQEPLSVKGAMERTQVPADCHLELFASEPDIGKPIAFAWDERGRLWVAETSDYPHGVNPNGRGNDRIKICEDTDGDGKADKFTVFADKLNIPTGLVFARGGVVVSQPPRFLFLKDTDGDDKADTREEIITGWGIGDTHGQAGNLRYGLDNWLYGSVGYDGFEGVVGGKKLNFTMGSYRFAADGSKLEFLHQFTNNTWAQSANEAGDQFGGTANGAPIFFGGIPATVVPPGLRAMTARKINVVNDAHPITPNFRQVDVFNGYTAACNSVFLYSKNMPARFQGMAMVCEPTMKLVALMDVRQSGAGFTALDGMNLFASSDEWTSPVYAEVGPDGAVWIADWQNFIIQHNPTPSLRNGGYDATTGVGGAHENPLRDHSRGRIYRVVWNQAKPVKKNLEKATDAQLVAALNDDVQYWRLLAQRLLVEGKKTGAAPALRQMVTANDGTVGAIHALWTLQGLGMLDEAAHKTALMAKDARLRRNAIRAISPDAAGKALYFGSGVVSDADPLTRLAACVKLAEFETDEPIRVLAGKLATDKSMREDEWLREIGKVLGNKHKAVIYKEGPNLLPNPGLEHPNSEGMPDGWTRRDYMRPQRASQAVWSIVTDPKLVHGGQSAMRVVGKPEAPDWGVDTSIFADVPLKPNTDYKLSGFIKAPKLDGRVSLNDNIGRAETRSITVESNEWLEVETSFNSGRRTKASINLLMVGSGEAIYDDVKLVELMPVEEDAAGKLTGDPKKGEEIFWKHPAAACMNCHMLGGKGSTVGPALDGISKKKDEAYILQSLLEPNAKLAEGFEKLGASPMPPMGLILKPQELADIQAFLQTLK